MATMTTARRRQLLENAEGFLELGMALEASVTLDSATLDKLSHRTLACLNEIQQPMGYKPYVLFLKGQACRLASRHAQAIQYFEQSRRIDPENIHLYFSLAWSYKRVGRILEAIECMQRAVELDAESGIAHYNLACYYALDEQVESALMHLSYAFELNHEYREMAQFETDFDLIRSDPRFSSMTSIVV